MKILLLSGFLGSGKTSALLQMAAYMVRRSGRSDTSVMIIENEIGEVGVDDKVLKAGGLAVRELFAGCACCTGGADLISDIRSIRETADPEWIIIEATGVAYPLEIKNNVEACFHVPGQVECADCILLNKVDLVDEAAAEKIAGELRAYNPKAELHKVIANKPIDDGVWAFLEG